MNTDKEPINQSLIHGVMPSFIFLVTNETERTVESAWYNFQDAKKECKKWEKMKPRKDFMVVELSIN
jgi:hypothetical protein